MHFYEIALGTILAVIQLKAPSAESSAIADRYNIVLVILQSFTDSALTEQMKSDHVTLCRLQVDSEKQILNKIISLCDQNLQKSE